MKGVVVVALATLASLAVAGSSPARVRDLQHVTLIGDSVADGVELDPKAVTILEQGVDLDLEVAPCRRVEGLGCPYQGVRPPSVVQLVQSLGARLGPNVVVAAGYNDYEAQFAGNLEDALAALKAAGVKRVWWLTLRAAEHPYLTMNDDLRAAAQQHPELSIVDWNLYSRSHPPWFQADGIHLVAAGAEAMATLVHKTLVAQGVASPPPRVTTSSLPPAVRDRPYRARLSATAGRAPYRWQLLERAPAGIHLEPDGVVQGVPLVPAGTYAFGVSVRDAAGSFATRRLTFRVSAA